MKLQSGLDEFESTVHWLNKTANCGWHHHHHHHPHQSSSIINHNQSSIINHNQSSIINHQSSSSIINHHQSSSIIIIITIIIINHHHHHFRSFFCVGKSTSHGKSTIHWPSAAASKNLIPRVPRVVH